MRVVNRVKVGRVKAWPRGWISERRRSGIMAMRASLRVGDGWCYPHFTNKEALPVDANCPQKGQKKS
jgi:hypothetical protein